MTDTTLTVLLVWISIGALLFALALIAELFRRTKTNLEEIVNLSDRIKDIWKVEAYILAGLERAGLHEPVDIMVALEETFAAAAKKAAVSEEPEIKKLEIRASESLRGERK